jgi:hypothetical protein
MLRLTLAFLKSRALFEERSSEFARLKLFGEAEPAIQSERPKGVGKLQGFSFSLGAFLFLLLAIKEKEMHI